jgi:bis(5'-nucleosidyl)-tetraphosphatase
MPAEHSAGAIVYRKEKGKNFYLLLEYRPDYWGFSKGNIETGEAVEETARREIREETGLTDLQFVEGFKVREQYVYTRQGQRVFKTVSYLLAQTATQDIKISWEHSGFVWLPYEEALEKTTFPSDKKLLQQAREFLVSTAQS